MTDIIVLAVVLLVVAAALLYIRKEKKNGVKCIGCPNGASCGSQNMVSGCSGGCSGCGSDSTSSCGCHADM